VRFIFLLPCEANRRGMLIRSIFARPLLATTVLLLSAFAVVQAQTNLQYQEPSKAIVDLVDTRPTPSVEVSPKDKAGKQWILIENISGFVLLPLESHGYAGRESVLHMLWEMNNWMSTYVKNPTATAAAQH